MDPSSLDALHNDIKGCPERYDQVDRDQVVQLCSLLCGAREAVEDKAVSELVPGLV